MAFTTMNANNSLVVKRWEMETWVQAARTSVFGRLFNRGSVYFPQEALGKDAKGDGFTFAYASKLTKAPIGEGGTLDGNEEALDLRAHNMTMNVQRIGVLNPNVDTIEQQRTFVNFEEVTKRLLTPRVKEIIDTSILYQLAGANPTSLTIDGTSYTAGNIVQVQGQNTIVAPTANRVLRPGNVANDESLTPANKFSLDLIDIAMEMANLVNQPIEALDDDMFDLYISPEQYTDLKQDTSGRIQWYINAQAEAAGGDPSMLRGTRFENNVRVIGTYAGVNIIMAPRVAYGVNSSTSAVIPTVRRAVLVGRDALSFASPFGGRPTDDDVPVKFFAQFKDYDYWKGIEARLLWGAKKMTPTGKDDVGVIVIPTYAAPHSNITY